MTKPAQQLRRRPEGAKTLIYLDQSTLSDLVSDPEFSSLRDLLNAGVATDQLLCPWSPEHHSETFDAGGWREMAELGDELSMGIQIRSDEEMNYSELYAAAAEFSGEPPPGPIWSEAFSADPHTPRESLFPGGFRVNVSFPPGEIDKESTTYTRELEDDRMTAIYVKARELGRTFEQQAECEFAEMVYWRLGPLSDPARFRGDLVRKALAWEEEAKAGIIDVSVGSPYGLASSMAVRRIQIEHLVERYPQIAAEVSNFVESEALRKMPSLRYPALLRAGLVLTPNRKAKRGDGFDLSHLMKGISRCDIVTADGGMAQMVAGFKLIPDGVRLFRSADREGLQSSVEDRLSAT